MTFATGILIWTVLGIAAGLVFRTLFRGPTTTLFLSLCFGVFGALIGGMLGVAGYIAHEPHPISFGGMLGAVAGGILFSFIYNQVARRAI